jgi:TetR/AcrR family transcriptional regulator, transcriptional repressor of aconitase
MDPATAHDAAPARRGPYPKGLRRRKEIVDQAIELFAERGDEGASLRAIAERIGVSHAALRHYFPSREELLVEVHRSAEAAMMRADPSPADEPALTRMIRATEQNRAIPGTMQLYATLIARAVEGESGSRAYVADRFAARRTEIAARLREGIEAGTVPADLPADAMAALVVAAADGLQTQRLLDPGVDVTEALRLLERVGRTAADGTRTSAGAAPDAG